MTEGREGLEGVLAAAMTRAGRRQQTRGRSALTSTSVVELTSLIEDTGRSLLLAAAGPDWASGRQRQPVRLDRGEFSTGDRVVYEYSEDVQVDRWAEVDAAATRWLAVALALVMECGGYAGVRLEPCYGSNRRPEGDEVEDLVLAPCMVCAAEVPTYDSQDGVLLIPHLRGGGGRAG